MPGKILITDDQSSNRILLRALLENEFYSILEARNGEEAIEIAQNQNLDLIIMDIEMPILSGVEACRILKSNPQTASIPIIMVTAHCAQEQRNYSLSAGAEDYLTRPVDPRVLYARISNLIRLKQLTDELELRIKTAEGHIDREAAFTTNYEDFTILHTANFSSYFADQFNTKCVSHDDDALNLLLKADAIIIPENLPWEGSGLRLTAHIRAEWQNRLKVIIFVAESGEFAGLRALTLGANDYLMKDFDKSELIIRLKTQLKRKHYTHYLQNYLDEGLKSAIIDPLTGLHNRRYFYTYIPSLLERSNHDGRPIAVMMLDLDHFKSLNDTYGHDVGDLVLSETAERLKRCLRASDLIVRWGGEEFVIVLSNLERFHVEIIAERLKYEIELRPFRLTNGNFVDVTISIGVCYTKENIDDISGEIKLADEALYQAKALGRNRVAFSTPNYLCP